MGVAPSAPPPRTHPTASPPNCGVKPPGNISWKVKQLGSSSTLPSATGSGTQFVIFTTGQFAEPSSMPSCASRTSPTRSVSPLSRLKTPRARVGVAEEEPARNRLAGIVGVPVDLQAIAEEAAEVAPQLEVVVDGGRTPDLRRVSDVGIPGGDERGSVVALDAAAGGVRLSKFGAQVDKPASPSGRPMFPATV